MGRLACLLLLILPNLAFAGKFVLLDEASSEYKNYSLLSPNNRNPLTYPQAAKDTIAFNLKATIGLVAYWHQRVQGWTTSEQFRAVEYTAEIGLRLSQNIDLFHSHRSAHSLDRSYQFPGGWPLEDAVGIRFYFYRSDRVISIF